MNNPSLTDRILDEVKKSQYTFEHIEWGRSSFYTLLNMDDLRYRLELLEATLIDNSCTKEEST